MRITKITSNYLASCAVKTGRAVARKKDHKARHWRAMTFIPASCTKLSIRYHDRERVKRSIKCCGAFLYCLGMCRKTRVLYSCVTDVPVMVRSWLHTMASGHTEFRWSLLTPLQEHGTLPIMALLDSRSHTSAR